MRGESPSPGLLRNPTSPQAGLGEEERYQAATPAPIGHDTPVPRNPQ
jgi:hypothetical protein